MPYEFIARNGLIAQNNSIITGSLTVTGTITATTLVAQTITSSTSWITGSTKFGSIVDNTHQFTGSILQSGSLAAFAGSVGIGTTSPAYKLDVAVASTADAIRVQQGGFSRVLLTGDGVISWGPSANTGVLTWDTGYASVNAQSTNDLRLTTNGGGLLIVKSGGNVGIGTTSPAAKLDVSGTLGLSGYLFAQNSGNYNIVHTQAGAAGIYLGGSGDPGNYYDNTNHYFRSIGGGTTYVLINGSGNVGIGTTSPGTRTEIYRVEGSNRTTYTDLLTITANATTNPYSGHGGGILFKGTTYTSGTGNRSWGRIGMQLTDFSEQTTGENMFFEVAAADNSDTLTRAMTIQYNGNVGINTTSPVDKLDVSGDVVFGSATERLSLRSGGIGFNRKVSDGAIYDSSRFAYQFNHTPSATNTSDYLALQVYSGSGALITGGALVINGVGNVGIGTTTPANKLHIEGNNVFVRISNPSTGDGGIKISYQNSDTHGLHLIYNPGSAVAYIDNTYPTSSGQVYGDIYFRQNIGGGTMTTRMTIQARSGNIGIGTTSPSSRLHVVGSSVDVTSQPGVLGYFVQPVDGRSVVRIENNLANSSAEATGTALSLVAYSDSSNNPGTSKHEAQILLGAKTSGQDGALRVIAPRNINFYTNAQNVVMTGSAFSNYGTFVATITSGGNVGIGTTSPNSPLSVQGNTNLGNNYGNTLSSTYTTKISGYALRYDSSNRYGNYGVLILNSDNGWTSGARRYMLTNGLDTTKFAIIRSADATTDPSFGDGGVVSSGTADFVINNAGNVGIGTTSPVYKLHVSGSSAILKLDSTGATFGNPSINMLQGGVDTILTATNNGLEIGTYSAHPIYFKVNASTTAMTIASGGNVGVGTTAPAYKFQSNGPVGDWAGYFKGSSTANQSYGMFIDAGSSSSDSAFMIRGYDGTTMILRVLGNGNVGIGTQLPAAKFQVTGSTNVVNIAGSGSATASSIFSVDGNNGRLFEITDDLSDSIFSANTIAGLPVIEAFSDYSVRLGTYNAASGSTVNITGSNVGIGRTDPAYRLDVVGNTRSDNVMIGADVTYGGTYRSLSFGYNGDGSNRIFATHDAADGMYFAAATGTGFAFRANGGQTNHVQIIANGNVGIGSTAPAYKLDVAGTIRATGDVIAYSDARVKENVETISDALAKVTSLRGVSYTRKDSEDKSRKVGVIAQEVLDILPEVVQQDTEGNYSVAYGNVVGVLIEAIKELKAEIDILKNK